VYLLDTNHCSRLIDGDPQVIAQLQAKNQAGCATSVVTRGELLFMAWNSQRREENKARVQAFLNAIRIYAIDPAIADAYGEFKAALIRHFGPKQNTARRKIRIQELGIHDNDLWIAAIALKHGLTIVSADRDFARMKEVRPMTLESWWTPSSVSPNSEG
jgi:tRNA(fMet)-specific endonuclease VapC